MKAVALEDEIACTVIGLSLDAGVQPLKQRVFIIEPEDVGMPSAHGVAGLVRVCPELPLLGLPLIDEDNSLIVPVRPEDARPNPRFLRFERFWQTPHVDSVMDAHRLLHRNDGSGENADSMRGAQCILGKSGDLLSRKSRQSVVRHL